MRIFEGKGYGCKAQPGKFVHSTEALIWLLRDHFARNLGQAACRHFKTVMLSAAPHAA
jgi:hypothetical protein